ncbi:MAG: SHOCT domain-containing protein [Anaerolineae bacterium]
MMVFMLLFPIALIALAVWGIGWLFPSGQRQPGRSEHGQDPGAALALRYARGEVSREEFLRIREELL